MHRRRHPPTLAEPSSLALIDFDERNTTMGPAVIGLAGVVLGVVSSLFIARLSARSTQRLAERARTEERIQATRHLAADAYVAAVDSIAWLSTTHVEDSVDPQFSESYASKTERAVVSLRTAKQAMNKAAALGVDASLTDIATEAARLLDVLDDAWHGAQEYRLKMITTPSGKTGGFYERIFGIEYSRLGQARLALKGFDDGVIPRDEIDRGRILPGSLLHQLRNAIGLT
jgi:hypothetical protein